MTYGDAYAQNNAFPESFPAAVRVGINASLVLDQLAMLVRLQMPPNGYLVEAGGGYETAGTSIAVNEMLLQSWEGFLRFFPVYPDGEPAEFESLRAVGAFLVWSRREADGRVVGTRVVSEAGRNCTVLPPPGTTMKVVGAAGAAVPTQRVTVGAQAGLWRFATAVGGAYSLTFESVAMHRPAWKSDEQTDAQGGLTLTRYNNTALTGPGLSRSVVTSLEEIATCEASACGKPSSLLLTGRVSPPAPGRYGFRLHFEPPLSYPSAEAYSRLWVNDHLLYPNQTGLPTKNERQQYAPRWLPLPPRALDAYGGLVEVIDYFR